MATVKPVLTNKQETFCLEYVKQENNGTKAALKAYDCDEESARRIASENLTKVDIVDRISQLRSEAASATIMTVKQRKERLSEIASANLTDYMEMGQDGSWVNIGPETKKAGAIQEIHSRTTYDKDTSTNTVHTSLKLHDPVRALDLLNKMDGLYQDHQTNIYINKVDVSLVRSKVADLLEGYSKDRAIDSTCKELEAPSDVNVTPESTDVEG